MSQRILFALLMTLTGCIATDPPNFGCDGGGCACVVNDDCETGHGCVARTCVPVDPCAAGIYIADRVPDRRDAEGEFPINALVRQVSGLATGVSVDEGVLRVVNAGEPRLFEIDFYDHAEKPPELGLFVETRMRLNPDSVECSAVLYLWPTRTDRVKICFGGGRIGLARPGGGSTSLVETPPDLTEDHVYRIEYKPIDAADADGGAARDANFVIELYIDGEAAAVGLTVDNLPAPDAAADRAPLIGFGAEAPGTVLFDYVRWGCNVNSGTCLPALQDNDTACETERRSAGACGGNAVAVELCDDIDNDCDGSADEDFTATFPDGRPISFNDFGSEVFKGEACGLSGACAPAIVVCSDDKLGLRCDVEDFAVEETCDGQDNDCDGLPDEDFGPRSPTQERLYRDPVTGRRLPLGDPCGQGVCAGGEVTCENLQPICSTARLLYDETCGNRLDDDCDGAVDEAFDLDADGFQSCLQCENEPCAAGPHDCDDSPLTGAAVNPAAEELCNRVDDDCDGQVDEGFDRDGDGFSSCPAPGVRIDCDDDPSDDRAGEPPAAERNPGAAEQCDNADNDCDGVIDEGFALAMGDGRQYTSQAHCGRCGNDCAAAGARFNTAPFCVALRPGGFGCATDCAAGFVDVDGDVGENAAQFWNGADAPTTGCECAQRQETLCDSGAPGRTCTELCNGVDDDCDGLIDEAADMDLPTCWDGEPADRQTGICQDGRRRCIDGRIEEACFGAVLPEGPRETVCDGRDEDCDGRIDEGLDLIDPDGVRRVGDPCVTGLEGVCADGRWTCTGAELRCVSRVEPGPEVCNGLDDDCDGVFEEDTDGDGDGVPLCRPCEHGEVPNAEGWCVFDCNDTPFRGRSFSPNIDERCTGVDAGEDNDCDGRIDEGC